MYEYLDRRYALALYEVAEQKGKVDEYLGDLREICKLIEDNKDFFEVIKHPQIGTKQKKKTFINIFKGKIDEELLSFLLILIEKDRILFLKEKLKEMEKKMANQVNSSTFKKNQSQKKKNPWIPLVVIVVLALLMVLLNYFMLDVTNAVYQTQQETVQTESTTAE